MDSVSLRNHLAEYPRAIVLAAATKALGDAEHAGIIAAWLTSDVEADADDPPPLDSSTINAILYAVRRALA